MKQNSHSNLNCTFLVSLYTAAKEVRKLATFKLIENKIHVEFKK